MKRLFTFWAPLYLMVLAMMLTRSFSLLSSNTHMIIKSQPNTETCFNVVTEDISSNPVSVTVLKCLTCKKVYFLYAADRDECKPL